MFRHKNKDFGTDMEFIFITILAIVVCVAHGVLCLDSTDTILCMCIFMIYRIGKLNEKLDKVGKGER